MKGTIKDQLLSASTTRKCKLSSSFNYYYYYWFIDWRGRWGFRFNEQRGGGRGATASASTAGSNPIIRPGKVPIIDFRLCNYLPQAEDVMIIIRCRGSMAATADVENMVDVCVVVPARRQKRRWRDRRSDSHAFMAPIKCELRYGPGRLMGHSAPTFTHSLSHWVAYLSMSSSSALGNVDGHRAFI